MVTVFVSCSSLDESVVDSLLADVRQARMQAWPTTASQRDDARWTTILKQIRHSEVFVLAVSNQALNSERCRAELAYAKTLGLPVLPVQVGEVSGYQGEQISNTHMIDYREPSRRCGIDLVSALHENACERRELPDPLPQPPPMPREYLHRLDAQVHDEAGLTPSDQLELLLELRAASDEEAPTTQHDIHRLLSALRNRDDVTLKVAVEIDSILADMPPPTKYAGESARPDSTADPSSVIAELFGLERDYRIAPTVAAAGTPLFDPVTSAAVEDPSGDDEHVGIDDLLERAVAAINRGDREAASALVEQVLAVDDGNIDAEDLLTAPPDAGEIRRLTILFADLVDSTVLSTRVEPETYRLLVGRYREQVLRIVDRYEGHVGSTKGDGLLVVFGYPTAHENDVRRAVQAGLEITREVSRLSEQAERRFGLQVNVRVGVHRGVVYLDTAQDDVYGLAANLAARVSGLAAPGTLVVSDAVEPLIKAEFQVEELAPAPVKGVEELIRHYRVVGERQTTSSGQSGPVVGRDRELARLEKSWARAKAGTLTTPGVTFRGEAGIGKSRLAAAATNLVRRDGGRVVELVGSPFHPDAGLHPVRALLEGHCGIDRQTDAAQRLSRLHDEIAALSLDPEAVAPLLAPVLGIAPEHGYRPVPAEGRKLQEMINDAVEGYLRACFGEAPGLLLAEDAHWFDSSTLEVLGQVLGGAEGRLLVVITGRDGTWLDPQWQVKLFDLKPLSDAETDELIQTLNPGVTAEQCASVRRRCDGVPFYIEQVVAGLTSSAGADDLSQVPDPLYEPLFARLLSAPNVVPVVEAAAVIGRHVDRSLLCAVTSLDEDEVDDVLDELEKARVIEPHGISEFRFRHELLREVAAELAPPSVRRGLHAKIADELIEQAAGEPDWRLVAAHYRHAERHTDAASAFQKASADARLRGALGEARSHLGHALEELGKCPPSTHRDRLEIAPRLVRGFLASAVEGYQSPAVAEDFERCLQLAGTDIRADEVFATLVALSSYYVPRADLRRASQVLELVDAGAEGERHWFRPAIQSAFGMVAFLRGDFGDAQIRFEQATTGLAEDDAHQIGALWFIPDDPIALAHEHLAMNRLFQGDISGAEAEFANAVRRAQKLEFPQGPYNHVYAIDIEIWMRAEAQQFDEARALVTDMIERAERYGFDFWQLFGATEQTLVEATELLTDAQPEAGALQTQIDAVTGFIEFWRSVGLYAYQTHYDCLLAQLLVAAGRLDEARDRVEIALDIARNTEMHMYDAELLRTRAHTWAEPADRHRDFAAAIALSRRQGNPLFELRSAIDDFELRGISAVDALTEAIGMLPADCELPEYRRAQCLIRTDSQA
ncbi:protein kinase [Mycolicibacterium flavescens]|uniref:adenylate/guanylate cyclase domain-containing protein n=1 Tax=Mycobacterium neumannii TaxID=2048551 RepID=UPI000B941814|nr:adenylate/guanylate cyclase domain-containing protein [Mycobacterium neumannii]VEG40764.1 protein kinase [Mycolicibacterium flavescens]